MKRNPFCLSVPTAVDADCSDQAKTIASVCHLGQWYNGGPYITHPAGVADMVKLNGGTIHQICAAWLHDVVEDTDYMTADRLRELGVSPVVIELVGVLTRTNYETYDEYIARVARHPEAIMIKLADLEYNLSHNPKEGLRTRYEMAVAQLRATISGKEKA